MTQGQTSSLTSSIVEHSVSSRNIPDSPARETRVNVCKRDSSPVMAPSSRDVLRRGGRVECGAKNLGERASELRTPPRISPSGGPTPQAKSAQIWTFGFCRGWTSPSPRPLLLLPVPTPSSPDPSTSPEQSASFSCSLFLAFNPESF